jgi:hypothetical protein
MLETVVKVMGCVVRGGIHLLALCGFEKARTVVELL